MSMKQGNELKRKIMEGRFVIPANTCCDAFGIKGRSYKGFRHKICSNTLFTGEDLIVDPAMLQFRPKAAFNPFTRQVPAEIMNYCYQAAKAGKMSFLMTAPDGDNMVFCVAAKEVNMPGFYWDMVRGQ